MKYKVGDKLQGFTGKVYTVIQITSLTCYLSYEKRGEKGIYKTSTTAYTWGAIDSFFTPIDVAPSPDTTLTDWINTL